MKRYPDESLRSSNKGAWFYRYVIPRLRQVDAEKKQAEDARLALRAEGKRAEEKRAERDGDEQCTAGDDIVVDEQAGPGPSPQLSTSQGAGSSHGQAEGQPSRRHAGPDGRKVEDRNAAQHENWRARRHS